MHARTAGTGLLRRAARDRVALAKEDGFTLIELLVAMTVLVIGVFALISTLDESRNLGNVSQHQAAAAHFAEQELESWLARPYNTVALTQDPTTASPADANLASWISTGQANLPSSPNDERPPNTGPASNEVVCAAVSTPDCPIAGSVQPIGTWADDKFSTRGRVYRYVTWVNDAACSDANCPGTKDYKRITIAVTITRPTGAAPVVNGQGPKVPIVVSAVKTDPSRVKGNKTGADPPLGTP